MFTSQLSDTPQVAKLTGQGSWINLRCISKLALYRVFLVVVAGLDSC
jgi:hypothetical protein